MSLIVLTLTFVGCSGQVQDTGATASTGPDTTTGGGSSVSASSTSLATTSAGSSASASATATASPTTGASTSGAEATSSTCTFVCEDTEGPPPSCDVYAQDCPDGEKCTYGPGLQDTRCVAVVADPGGIGEACTQIEIGQDTCDVGQICWFVDPETGLGECIGFCHDPDQGGCDDPMASCWLGCQTCLGLCFPECDPLGEGCDPGQLCLPHYDTYFCAVDASGDAGAYGDPCAFVNSCDPGLLCVDAALVPGCVGDGCCAPYCDVDAPSCPDAELGVICQPLADDPKPGTENVGVCTLP